MLGIAEKKKAILVEKKDFLVYNGEQEWSVL